MNHNFSTSAQFLVVQGNLENEIDDFMKTERARLQQQQPARKKPKARESRSKARRKMRGKSGC